MPRSAPVAPRGPLLPPDRILFSALPALLDTSRSTVQRRFRPGQRDPERHAFWRDRLDIRQRRVADRGATCVVLHCSRPACEALRRELLGMFHEDPLAD